MTSPTHTSWNIRPYDCFFNPTRRSDQVYPYLYKNQLFLVKGIIEKDPVIAKLFGKAFTYKDFEWPIGMEKLPETECRKVAKAYSNDYVWLGSRLQKQIREFFGETNSSQPMKIESPPTSSLLVRSKQLSEKKSSVLKRKTTSKRSLNSKINKKLHIDPRCDLIFNENINTLEVTKLYCGSLTDLELHYVVEHFPNLKVLRLCHCSELTDDGLIYLQKLSILEYLDLCFSFKHRLLSTPTITDKGLSALANLPLRYLDLDRCYDVTDKTIELFKKCPLEYLCINHCQITDKGLSLLVAFFPHLRTLTMSTCNNISNNGLASLKKLLLLDDLELHWCRNLSDPLRKYFRNRPEVEGFYQELDKVLAK